MNTHLRQEIKWKASVRVWARMFLHVYVCTELCRKVRHETCNIFNVYDSFTLRQHDIKINIILIYRLQKHTWSPVIYFVWFHKAINTPWKYHIKCVLYHVSSPHVISRDIADRILHGIWENVTCLKPQDHALIFQTYFVALLLLQACKGSLPTAKHAKESPGRCSGRRTAGAWHLILSTNYRDLQRNLTGF